MSRGFLISKRHEDAKTRSRWRLLQSSILSSTPVFDSDYLDLWQEGTGDSLHVPYLTCHRTLAPLPQVP